MEQNKKNPRTAADAHAEDMADIAYESGAWDRFTQQYSRQPNPTGDTKPIGKPIEMSPEAHEVEVALGMQAIENFLKDK